MMIDSEEAERIAVANNIVGVIGEHTRLKRAGPNFKGICPFHEDKSLSLMVNPERQTFHCFECGAGGSVFRFVMAYEKVDFREAARKLAERAKNLERAELPRGEDLPVVRCYQCPECGNERHLKDMEVWGKIVRCTACAARIADNLKMPPPNEN